MSTAQLLIPSKLRVGFQARSDTYSGRLGFVIYFDAQGVLRKATAWSRWCARSTPPIDPVDYDNLPTEGFVLNRDGGGSRHSYGWHVRNPFARVYDPRGFEVEITIPNLFLILREGTCHPGKGLEGKFVYAWDNQQLVLLPVKSVDYEQSTGFTALQGLEVTAKDLVAGHTYETKRQEHWVYLGRFDYYYAVSEGPPRALCPDETQGKKPPKPRKDKGVRKKYIFAKQAGDKWVLVYLNEPKGIARVSSTTTPDNFAHLVDLHTRTFRGSRVEKLVLRPSNDRQTPHGYDKWAYEIEPGTFALAETYSRGGKGQYTHIENKVSLRAGTLVIQPHVNGYAFAPDCPREHWQKRAEGIEWREPTDEVLYARLECGVEIPVVPWHMRKD